MPSSPNKKGSGLGAPGLQVQPIIPTASAIKVEGPDQENASQASFVKNSRHKLTLKKMKTLKN